MRPFTFAVAQAELDDLAARLAATRWPALAAGPDRGVPDAQLRALVQRWRHGYDWRAAEAELNALPQLVTDIDGASVHLCHVRSPEPDATPLLLLHGWPGSLVEFLDVLGPLTDPRAHGGDPRDAFHVVVPTMPGFGPSGPAPGPGWHLGRVAQAWRELMARLGHDRYLAHGGDFGALVALELGRIDPHRVAGAHVTFLVAPPSGPDDVAALDPADRARAHDVARFLGDPEAYVRVQASRPATLGYGLTDSPVGQLAWILDRFAAWTDPDAAPLHPDRLLTNTMLYWLSRSAASSAQHYLELGAAQRAAGPGGPAPVPVPVGVAVFAHDFLRPARPLAERFLPHLVSWNEYPRGGHFAAMEQPRVLVDDLRAFARATSPQPVG